jgi:hypothetical protein
VKVGHCQAFIPKPPFADADGGFFIPFRNKIASYLFLI